MSPGAMFRAQVERYSKFDEQGVPTHDAMGEAITESQRKKLRKQWQVQDKKYRQHLARQS